MLIASRVPDSTKACARMEMAQLADWSELVYCMAWDYADFLRAQPWSSLTQVLVAAIHPVNSCWSEPCWVGRSCRLAADPLFFGKFQKLRISASPARGTPGCDPLPTNVASSHTIKNSALQGGRICAKQRSVAESNPRLVGIGGPLKGAAFPLPAGEVSIGRDSSNHLWAPIPHCRGGTASWSPAANSFPSAI